MRSSISGVVSRGHELLAEVAAPGDLVVDLTAGRGHDTLVLWQMVAPAGQVIAFDVQGAALDATAERLIANGARIRRHQNDCTKLQRQTGVDLVAACHSCFCDIVPNDTITAVIANLGYLPGSDQMLITRPATTLSALRQATAALSVGGRMAIVVYPGHPGGADEARQVVQFFEELERDIFEGVHMRVANKPQAPGLLLAEKRIGVGKGEPC